MKTRKIDVEQIHVYGCSMPAGDELTVPRDKDYVPLAGKELIACEKSDKRQAFPKTVGDHFGIPVINNAFWGASNEQSAYILLEDIMKQTPKSHEDYPTDLKLRNILFGINRKVIKNG